MSINYTNLRCCIEAHTNWPAESDENLAAWCNTPNSAYSFRPEAAPARDIWLTICQYTDYENLPAGQRDVVNMLLAGNATTIDISENITPEASVLIRIFPAGTDTRTALLEAFTYDKTPAQEFEVGKEPNSDHVAEARANWVCS